MWTSRERTELTWERRAKIFVFVIASRARSSMGHCKSRYSLRVSSRVSVLVIAARNYLNLDIHVHHKIRKIRKVGSMCTL